MKKENLVRLFLRLSIASVFIYAATASLLEPQNWIGYIPQMLKNIFPAQYLLWGFSIYEFILGVWILSGWKTFYGGLLSIVTLLGIIATNIYAIDIVFRDFAILFSAAALTMDAKK